MLQVSGSFLYVLCIGLLNDFRSIYYSCLVFTLLHFMYFFPFLSTVKKGPGDENFHH